LPEDLLIISAATRTGDRADRPMNSNASWTLIARRARNFPSSSEANRGAM
jgi:hypothetical protein